MGLFPLISKPSRITGQSATLIDNIFTNEVQHVNISGQIINDITDHLPIFTIYRYKVKRQEVESSVQKRRTDSNSVKLLNSELINQNWDNIYSQTSVNDCYEHFLQKVDLVVNKVCPMETKTIKHGNKCKPWLTKGLLNACKKKNTMYKTFIKTKLESDETKYKAYKNKLTKILRNAEKSYFNEKLEKEKHNIKATWKILNRVIRGVANPSKIPDVFIDNNSKITDKKDIANGFNIFFC